jgi:hypothetical protein
MMAKYKEGQAVWFYIAPGDIRHDIIRKVGEGDFYLLGTLTDWWDAADLFSNIEEAKAGLSAGGRRLDGCMREAEIIAKDKIENAQPDTVLRLASMLFDAGED